MGATWSKIRPQRYSTNRSVVISNSRLAWLHFGLQIAVLVYVAVQILVFHKFAVLESPHGFVQPWNADMLDRSAVPAIPDYCDPTQNQKYNTNIGGFVALNFTCRDVDALGLLATHDGGDFVVKLFQQERDFVNDKMVAVRNIFLRGAEYATFNFGHGFSTSTQYSTQVPTQLVKNGELFRGFENSLGVIQNIAFWQFMDLAGISMTDGNVQDWVPGSPVLEFRVTGAVILAKVKYRNFDSANPLLYDTRADISAVHLKRLWGVLDTQIVYHQYPTMITATGIRIKFITEGLIARFDLFSLVLAVLSGVVLLSVSTRIVDFISANFLGKTSQKFLNVKNVEVDLETVLPNSAVSLERPSSN